MSKPSKPAQAVTTVQPTIPNAPAPGKNPLLDTHDGNDNGDEGSEPPPPPPPPPPLIQQTASVVVDNGGERLIDVIAIEDHKCIIAQQEYIIKKDKSYKLPASVAHILTKAKKVFKK